MASTVNTVNDFRSPEWMHSCLHRDIDVPGIDILEAEIASFGELKLGLVPHQA